MQIITAREFRSNQGKFLDAAKKGQDVLLTSRHGVFQIIPMSDDNTLTARICNSLRQVKLMEEGKLKSYTVDDVLREL